MTVHTLHEIKIECLWFGISGEIAGQVFLAESPDGNGSIRHLTGWELEWAQRCVQEIDFTSKEYKASAALLPRTGLPLTTRYVPDAEDF
jgi:hypothetical protein